MKIDFSQQDERVMCHVTIRVPNCGPIRWNFAHAHTDKFYAGFVTAAMQSQMRDAIEKLRRDAYNEGWNDARRKKGGKRECFRRIWDEVA
jgi:hypothetical protein